MIEAPQPQVGRVRLAVLISGRGSNLAALVDAIAAGELNAQIVAVGCDRVDAGGIAIAQRQGIPVVLKSRVDYPDRATFEAELMDELAQFRPDWLILAGFMRVLSAAAVARWANRMINLHPSLLPLYPGLHTHTRALAAGDAVHGASVHLVTAELDGGPVLAQIRLEVMADDDAESLAARLRPLEHRLLVTVCALLADRKLVAEGDRILLNGRPLTAPLQLS